jgi:hypothetical protein
MDGGLYLMAKEHQWEELQAERPTDGYATLLHRMSVPGGYIYKDTTMYLRGLFGPKFTTSLAFVPDPPKAN